MTWSNNSPVIEAFTVIIASGSAGQGLFVYNGTPAAGNLIASIASTAATDSFGNPYPQGIGSFNGGLALQPTIIANSGQLRLSNTPQGAASDGILEPLFPTGGVLLSSGTGSFPDAVQEQWIPGNSGAVTGTSSTPRITLTSADVLSPVDVLLSGSVIATNNAGTAVTWASPTPGSGWALGPSAGSVQHLQYRQDAENNLFLVGAIHTTSATPSGSVATIATDHPIIAQRFVGVINNAGTPNMCFLEVSAGGTLSIAPTPTTANVDLYVLATLPLGIIP